MAYVSRTLTERLFLALLVVSLVTACAMAAPIVAPTAAPAATPSPVPTTEPAAPGSDSLETLPLVAELSPAARQVLEQGKAAGRNPHSFSRIGDCMSSSPHFLTPFGTGAYDLGEYGDLQRTIDAYAGGIVREVDGQPADPFTAISLAATEGFNSASVMEPLWADPAYCDSGETPLACEIRVANPAVALVMFGTNDVYAFDADKFEGYLRTVVEATLDAHVLPVLITFPPQPGLEAESRALNERVVQLAGEYDVPLINLWRALQDKPNHGIDPEHNNYLSTPDDGCMACFDAGHLSAGITEQNLLVLQTLDGVVGALSQ